MPAPKVAAPNESVSEGEDASAAQAVWLADVRTKFDDAISADRENRENGFDDVKFSASEQWPAAIKAQREAEGRPCLTVNELPQYVRQVTGDMRLNRPAIKVAPAEDGDVQVAEVYEGLIRSIEDQSDASRVYVERLEDSCRCNMGFMRVTTEYVSDEAFDLDLRIKGIQNPFSVVWDPAAQDPTLRDARYIFVYDDMPVADFKAAFPDKAVAGFDGQTTSNVDVANGSNTTSWVTSDMVRVAEYWCVEEIEVTLALLQDGRTIELPGNAREPIEGEVIPEAVDPAMIAKQRVVRRKKVCQYLVSGADILSGPHQWPGDRIPIVPVWGEQYRIGARKLRKSLIADAKDAMRMKNFAHSAYVERTAMAPKAPWLVTAKMIEGFETDWRGLATGNPSVLPYNPDPLAPQGPTRVAPAPVEAAWVQEMALATDMIKSTTGIYSASLGEQSNETSGKAIIARQKEGDVGSYVFVDNTLGAVREVGRILVQMIPHVYDAPRTIRIIGPQDEQGVLKVNQAGGPDLTAGKYDVSIQTGPSFSTRRVEAAQSMTEFAQAIGPQGAILLAPMIAKNMDWPQADEVAEMFKPLAASLVPQQPQGPDPAAAQEQIKGAVQQAQQEIEQMRQQALGEVKMAHDQAALDIQRRELTLQAKEMTVSARERATQQNSDDPKD